MGVLNVLADDAVDEVETPTISFNILKELRDFKINVQDAVELVLYLAKFHDAVFRPATSTMLITSIAGYIVYRYASKGAKLRYARSLFLKEKMVLYHHHTFRSARCHWLIKELGYQAEGDFEIKEYNPFTEDPERIKQYKREINKQGTVPALVLGDGTVLIESGGICLYLAHTYNFLLPKKEHSADYYNFSVYAVTHADPNIRCVDSYQNTILRYTHNDKEAFEKAKGKVEDFCNIIECHLKTRNYICGNNFTAADVIVGYCIMWIDTIRHHKDLSFFKNCPHTRHYLEKLRSRPLFKQCIGTVQEWTDGSHKDLTTK